MKIINQSHLLQIRSGDHRRNIFKRCLECLLIDFCMNPLVSISVITVWNLKYPVIISRSVRRYMYASKDISKSRAVKGRVNHSDQKYSIRLTTRTKLVHKSGKTLKLKRFPTIDRTLQKDRYRSGFHRTR